MRRFVGSALALIVGIGSAQAEPVERDVAWLAGSIDAPPGDAGRECLESTIRTLLAMAAFRQGHTPDDVVRSALAQDVTDPDELAMRQAEGELWISSHEPAAVAAEHLGRCLALDGVELKDGPPAKPCLETVTPAVVREVDDSDVHERARRFAACVAGGTDAARVGDSGGKAPCLVLLGGGGTQTGDAEVDNNWFKVDSALSYAVAAELRAKSYDVWPLIIGEPDGQRRFDQLWSKLTETHCTRTVQISYALRSTDGKGVDAFSFQADVLRFASGDDRAATTMSDYTKTYDFAMTADVMRNLSVSALGVKMADDMMAADVLPTH